MAKSKPTQKRSKKNRNKPSTTTSKPPADPSILLNQALLHLSRSQPLEALTHAKKALALLQPQSNPNPTIAALPALNLLGEISVELGDIDAAREYFSLAVAADPEGSISEESGGGAEKFLWLAQLSEQGGQESVRWFERGAEVLRVRIGVLEERMARRIPLGKEEAEAELGDKRRKLANALCGIAEVYMTDLSFDSAEAEAACDRAMTEALLVAPDSPETLQTLASVRISQDKKEDARMYLEKSISLWTDLAPEDPRVPEFPVRIALARLLMEAEMEEKALEVVARLIQDDDQSVEAWYLGGWCLHLMAEKEKDGEEKTSLQKRSRRFLSQTLKLYQLLEYEDERLQDHAMELVEALNGVLGEPPAENEEDDDDDEGWEDDEDDVEGGADEDEEMEGT
ncbi:TPR-like protein [Aulographum hederae CBS 113979]|uniref:TPR-like protein n=1 Tax=Aulographum hederae CBS 113979 TaxID=1176131 RepID=A0A6G1GIP7_9PEZI|nr:TPR-like protein [Aulographum hederae CBS 113979]